MHMLLKKQSQKSSVHSDKCLQPSDRTHFSKCHMTNSHLILKTSPHNSQKERPLPVYIDKIQYQKQKINESIKLKILENETLNQSIK